MAACEVACAYLREVLLVDQDSARAARAITPDAARCSRLDLYVDWQGGWHPGFEIGDERHFVKRTHAEMARRSADGAVTGYEIGKGAVRARIYDKMAQMKRAKVEWCGTLLAARNGHRYDLAVALWRLEFRLRREGGKSWGR